MDKIYLDNRSNLFTELIPFINRTTNLLQASAYLTWNSVLGNQINNIFLCKELKIPSYVYNHGLYGYEDHVSWITDDHTNIRNRPMHADKYLCWGKKDYEDLIKTGIPAEKLDIVGCSILWENRYLYNNGQKKLITNCCVGKEYDDPLDKSHWTLESEDHYIPRQLPDAKWITWFASHDCIDRHRQWTLQTFEKLKDIDNLVIKASDAWKGKDNPFEYMNYESFCECGFKKHSPTIKRYNCKKCKKPMKVRIKVMYGNINSVDNIQRMRMLLQETKVAVVDYVGTPSLMCYAMGVPVITLKNDYGLKDNGKTTYHTCDADILVELPGLNRTIKKVLRGEIDNRVSMQNAAEYLGDVSGGYPIHRILKVIG